jgi:hypothetical protein
VVCTVLPLSCRRAFITLTLLAVDLVMSTVLKNMVCEAAPNLALDISSCVVVGIVCLTAALHCQAHAAEGRLT